MNIPMMSSTAAVVWIGPSSSYQIGTRTDIIGQDSTFHGKINASGKRSKLGQLVVSRFLLARG